LVLIVFF